jgi:putative FmdB family regulatory protein
MPVYEYRCADDEAHAILEINRGINDLEDQYSCIECESKMVRHFTPFGIQFKGNGFYKTDNPK